MGFDPIGWVSDAITGGKSDAYRGLDKYADIKAAEAGPSEYFSEDPATRAAQMDALAEFQNQNRQGGLTAIDRARLADITNQTNQTAKTVQARVMDDASRRGMATSGNTLVAQQVAGQNAANQGANEGLQVEAQAQAAREQAVRDAAGVASGTRTQDYQRAAAQDAIDKFNAANRQDAQNQTFRNRLGIATGQAGVDAADATNRIGITKDIAKGFGAKL